MPDTPPAPADLPGTHLGRRVFLTGAAATGATLAFGSLDVRTAHAAVPTLDPFGLGVASGDPLPNRVILWTRLVRDPLSAEPFAAAPVLVRWELARDAAFTQGVRRGTAKALPQLGHSVHVDVQGLDPATDYWYRFKVGAQLSPSGRTRTAPSAGSPVDGLRLGIVNCQDWQNGYWPAYAGLAAEDLDVVLHLGDYIYEYDPASAFPDRLHTSPQTPGLDQLMTLADYRARHAQYKTDPALQAAHAAFPWIVTWDDHETENNYANLVDEIDDVGAMEQARAAFAQQRANAYQAYYEHMPIRANFVPRSSSLRIFRRFDFGDLVRLNVLDTRQYRTDQPGGFAGDFGPEPVGRANSAGTLMGQRQEQWLADGMRASSALWNVTAQQVMMSRIRFGFVPGSASTFLANLDQWDGYAPARTRFLRSLTDIGVSNPVVLAGDIHSSWFSDLKADFDDPASATVASEYVATSVSSYFPPELDAPLKAANPLLNPHVRYFDGSLHGYLRVDVDRERWLVEQRSPATIAVRTAPVSTIASYATAAGTPGVVPA